MELEAQSYVHPRGSFVDGARIRRICIWPGGQVLGRAGRGQGRGSAAVLAAETIGPGLSTRGFDVLAVWVARREERGGRGKPSTRTLSLAKMAGPG